MFAPYSISPASFMKTRLLGGTSVGALVLALSFAVSNSALAQEIDGADAANARVLSGGAAITSGATGGQFGAIDTNGGGNNPASITLTQSETISVFDSVGGSDIATVAGDFDISAGATGTLVFGRANDGTASDFAHLRISGDLEGADDGRGGNLTVSAFNQSFANASPFQVFGSTHMGTLSIIAGNSSGAFGEEGMDISATFGNADDDAFDVTGLTVAAGNGAGANVGGAATVTVRADAAGANIVTIGAGGVSLTGGDGGVDGHGGAATVVIHDSASIAGAVTITGGSDGSTTGHGGEAIIDFSDATGTVTITGALVLGTGTDTSVGSGRGGSASAIFASTTINANGGVVLTEHQVAMATLLLDGTGAQTFNGTVTAANSGDGLVVVNNTGGDATTVNITGDIGAAALRVGSIDLTNAGIVDFDGDLFVDRITATSNLAEAQFDGAVDVTTVNLHGVNTLLDFNGAVTIGAGNFELDGSGSANTTATFSGAVGGVGTLLLDDGAPAGDVEVHFDGTSAFSVANTIRGVDDNDGEIIISNTAGVTFNGRLGTMTTQGDRAFRQMSVAANGAAIFNNDVATQNFSVLGDGSTLTFNGAGAGPQMLVGNGGANGSLTLDDGTIILGNNIGNNDIIFDVTTGAPGAPGDPLAVNGTVMVQLSANIQNGDTVTLIDGDHADTIDNAEAALFTVTDTALTDFTITRTADGGGTTNANLVVTAAATTSAQAAATLGVSTGQADALRQAVTSATNAGDTAGLQALTTALNAGGTQATQAAQQVGPQGTTLGGGAQTAFDVTAQQQSIAGNRLAGLRSGDPRFVSAFAAVGGETGFSGGDRDGPYAPLAPRYTRSVWFQAFGGVANADGDVTGAGYDAGFGGAMIGIDGAISDTVTIGAFGSYSFSAVDGDGAGNAQLDANTYQIGVYGSYTGASFYLDAFASYAGSDNDISRTALAQTITASYDASQFAMGAALGVPLEVSSNVFITPNASLTYNHYDADSYTETGSAGFSARVNPGSASQLTGTLGARIHAVYEQADGTSFIPELRVGIIGDLIDDDAVSTATFVGGGTAFNVTGTDTDDIGALIGLGLTMENDSWSAGITYDADIRSDFMSHTARAEFRWKF